MNIVFQSSQFGIHFSNFAREIITSPTSRLRGVCDYPFNRAKRAGKDKKGFHTTRRERAEGGGGSAWTPSRLRTLSLTASSFLNHTYPLGVKIPVLHLQVDADADPH